MSGPKGAAVGLPIYLLIGGAYLGVKAISAAVESSNKRAVNNQEKERQRSANEARQIQSALNATVLPVATANPAVSAAAQSEREATRLRDEIGKFQFSDAMTKFTPDEIKRLNNQKTEFDALVRRANNADKSASQLRSEVGEICNRATALLDDAKRNSERVQKSGSRDDALIKSARRQMEDALKLKNEAEAKVRAAADYSRQAKDAFDAASALGKQFLTQADNVRQMATARAETAAKIGEKNQRLATSYNNDVKTLTAALGKLNHEKFAPGQFAALQAEINAFTGAVAKNDFAGAATQGKIISEKLARLESEVTNAQTAFETSRTAAQNRLQAARQEISPLKSDELIRWTGKRDEINGAYAELDAAEKLLAAENFVGAEKQTEHALGVIREWAPLAENNRVNSEQRNYIADVIMNALYEQGYDAPTFYHAAQNPDGSNVEYSDLTIFAKAPGKQGDMRMNIDLNGKVKLEVENIAEGEEAVCHQLIENLQKGMGDQLDFQMTDWGRAAHVNPAAKANIRQQEKVQEKTRERQR